MAGRRTLDATVARLGAGFDVRRLARAYAHDVGLEVDRTVAGREGRVVPVRRAVAVGLGFAAWGNALVVMSRIAGRRGELVTLVGQAVFVPVVVWTSLRRGRFDHRALGLTARPVRPKLSAPARSMLLICGAGILAAGVGAAVADKCRGGTEALTITRLLLATSLGEEVLFRGVLFAVWAGTGRSAGVVIAANASFFGLWHVAGSVHDGRFDVFGVVGPMVGAVLLFVWARVRFGSVAAPAIVHASGNLPAWVLVNCW